MLRAIVVPLLWLLVACDSVTPPVPPPPVARAVSQDTRSQEPPLEAPALHRVVFRDTDDFAARTVFLHGFGSNEEDMRGLASRLALSGSWVGYRAPTTLRPDRYAWFSVDFNAPEKRYKDEEVAQAVDLIIHQLEMEQQPVRLAGFSQGGMLSLYVALKRPDLVTEAISFSGPGPLPNEFETPLKTRMLLVHGTNDQVVAVSRAHAVRDRLSQAGGPFEYIEVPGMAHQITDDVIARARTWTQTRP